MPVTEVRAGVIVGAGSAAYEVIRDLVYHLPVLVTPRWVQSKSSPIALSNLLEYLYRVAALPQAAGLILDAGGPDYMTYESMMREFGEAVVGEVALADALNRDERASAFEGRFVLTPLTSLVFETEYRQDRFERTTSRDTDTVLVEGGLEFKPLALISGRARVGFRHFAPREATS